MGMNGLYLSGRTRFLNGELSWENDTFYAQCLTYGYEFDETHRSLLAIPNEARILLPIKVTGCQAINGAGYSEVIRVPGAGSDGTLVGFVIYADGPTEQDSTLIGHWSDILGLPAPLAGPILLKPDQTSPGWFEL